MNLTRSREVVFSLHYKPQGLIQGGGSKNLHTQKGKKERKKKKKGGGEAISRFSGAPRKTSKI